MKFFFPCFFLFFYLQSVAQIGIGTSTPHASSRLDVSSTTKGFLPPRMTSAQRTAISSPAAGLMVYQTDGTAGLYYYNGSAWIYVINSTSSTLPVASGGTGASTLTANALLTGNGTSAVGSISPGTAGRILYSDGTSWAGKTIALANTGSGTSFSNLQPYQSVGYFICTSGTFPTQAGNDPFIGEIAIYPYSYAPSGWVACDGSTLSINSNSALYSLLGTSFGGNGSTTFGLPDLRGRVVLGTGQLNGTGTNYTRGSKSGAETITLTTSNLPAHGHTISYN